VDRIIQIGAVFVVKNFADGNAKLMTAIKTVIQKDKSFNSMVSS
jgi:hypothetical protein